MKVHSALAVFMAATLLPGCATQEPTASGADEWVGTITTEGNVTTVVNQSGSVWAGAARLVEEASIGVESGSDPYMFGQVTAVWASHDRIYVVDWQVPAVRVYDLDGQHLLDLGRRGQGPGEFQIPVDVVAAGDDDAYVIENNMRMNVFAPDGTPRDTWRPQQAFEVGFGGVLTLTTDVEVWVPYFDREFERLARIRYGPDGFTGEPMLQPDLRVERECLSYESEGAPRSFCDLPFAPEAMIVFTPERSWAVGTSDAYRFELRRVDGSVLAIERFWDPVPVTGAEAEYRRQRITETIRERDPSWAWGDLELPTHKPAYARLIPDRNGRTWVLREMPSRQASDCPEEAPPCWEPEGYWLDAFDTDGRFLGSATFEALRVPGSGDLPGAPVFIDGETILAVLTDGAGTSRVKRYRLVLPSAE
jgi:hypothetical protein